MPTLQELDQVNINGNNFNKDQTVIEISGFGIVTTDITSTVKGIDYTETIDSDFDFALGSKRPSGIVSGNVTAEGTLTVSDAGLDKLNKLALNAGLPGLAYLGLGGLIDITISYTTYNGLVKTDLLQTVLFSAFSNGVNNSDLTYDREIPLKIAKVNLGVIA